MDCDGHLQLAADIPHGIETGSSIFTSFPEVMLSADRAEGLENFQTAGPVAMSLFDASA